MRIKIGNIIIVLLLFLSCRAGITQTVNMHLWATGENHNRAVKTVPLLDNYIMQENGDDVFNRYGSDSRIKTDATGFFYTKKIDDRWWIIDPDGYAGVDMSVTSLPDMDETKANWAFSLLRKNGYNGTGNFLGKEDMTKRLFNEKYAEKMSYTRRRNFFQSYRIERQKNYETPTAVKNNPQNYVTIFDPEWESYVDNFASVFANYKNERDLLGYYSDNEINFTEDQLKLFLTVLPVTDPNYQAAMNFLNEKSLDKNWVIANYDNIPAIRNEFLTLVMERYFTVVTTAIKKYDPNHLYLGTRLHGKSRDSETCVTISSKYCDIVSVNYYNYVFPSDQIANPAKWGKWLQKHDKPCMITEFYAKEYSSTYPNQPGAGFYTDDQSGRGIFYQSSCLDVLRSKYYVGWHYFRWQDDPAPNFSNKGIVNATDQEYVGMTSYMEELNRQVYHLIDYMDNKVPMDDSYDVLIPVKDDTYIQLSGSGQDVVRGNESELSLATPPSASGMREIMLKFDLGNYYDSLYRVVDAKIRLTYLSGDSEQKLAVTGIKDHNWNESTLTGIVASGASGLRNNYGKNRTKGFNNLIVNTPVYLNVRNWLMNEVNNQNISFRILTEKTSLLPSLWASKEHENTQLHPTLILSLAREQTSSNKEIQPDNLIDVQIKQHHLFINGIKTSVLCELYTVSGTKLISMIFEPGRNLQLNVDKGIYIVRIHSDLQSVTKKIQIK